MPSLVDSGAYLDQLYQEKFGRVPDAAGKAYWKAELESGKTSPEKIAQIFDNTDEAKQVKESKAQESRDFLEKTYAEELGREPDASGAEYWANEISSGRQTQDDVVRNIRASEEYQEQREPEEEEWQQEYDNQFNSAVGDIAVEEEEESVPEDPDEPVVGLPYIDPESEQGKKGAINEIYQDLLGRDSDQGGSDYWYGELESGRQTLDDIRANVGRSEEAANLESNKAFIEEQYEEGLDRGSDAGGMSYWLKDLATGQSREDVASNIRRSDEFSTQAEDYLDGLYENILERDPDAEGLDYWKEQLTSGNQTREDVEANINRSDEKWLGDTYKAELGRSLGEEGRDYWLDDMNERGQTREQVLANIRRSEEYLNRGEQECPTGQHLENGVCVNDAVTECPDGQRLENGQCVDDIRMCTMELCPDGQTKNENCECVDTEETECPEGKMRVAGSNECVDIIDEFIECPTGSTRDSTGACIPDQDSDPEECPVGQTRNASGVCEPEDTDEEWTGQCPPGQRRNASGVCEPDEEDDEEWGQCPPGQTRNSDGACEPEDTDDDFTGPCQNGYTRNESGACVEDPGTWIGEDPTEDDDIGIYMGTDPTEDTDPGSNAENEGEGTYMGTDPTNEIEATEDETRDPLDITDPLSTTTVLPGGSPRRGANQGNRRGATNTEVRGDMGYRQTRNEYRDLYNASLRDMASLNDRGEEDRVRYGELESRYGKLRADYESARREADSYRDAQRADETSRLRGGITVGGAPGSRRNSLRSGNTATSERSRRRGVSVRDDRRRDRSPSMQGIRSGF
tara:strand:+ start:526 stop:2925 length:2400 start_codon:yes stop_codon:yes gene_type:complete